MILNKNIKHNILETGVFIKGINGLIQLVLGSIILFVNSRHIDNFIEKLFSHELKSDPSDFIVSIILNLAESISVNTKYFIGIYIIVHGLINLFLFYAVWNNKKKFYPLAIIILLLLTFYQIYRFGHNHSVFLFFITIVDIIVIYLLADYLKEKSKNLPIVVIDDKREHAVNSLRDGNDGFISMV